MRLGDVLFEAGVLEPDAHLFFVRYAQPNPNTSFAGNLHHDDDLIGYNEHLETSGDIPRPHTGTEIWRQILNLGDEPRHLQLIDESLRTFWDNNIDPDKEFRPIAHSHDGPAIPPEILEPEAIRTSSHIIEIPPYDGRKLWVAEFWSSRILHAGLDIPTGHTMATAGAWRQPE